MADVQHSDAPAFAQYAEREMNAAGARAHHDDRIHQRSTASDESAMAKRPGVKIQVFFDDVGAGRLSDQVSRIAAAFALKVGRVHRVGTACWRARFRVGATRIDSHTEPRPRGSGRLTYSGMKRDGSYILEGRRCFFPPEASRSGCS